MLLWIALLIVPMLFGFYAQMRVMSAYSKNSQIGSRSRINGREAADAVMRSAGIHDVEIVEVPGHLTDHYDPMHKRLALSSANYHGESLAAVGVAAHEAGHAIQHKVGYGMMTLRQNLVPMVRFASPVAMLLCGFGLYFAAQFSGLLVVGAVALGIMTLFQFVTLPVEFDASRRAKVALANLGVISPDEKPGVNETLDAAALTYVAAFVASLGQLLHILLLLGNRRSDD